MNQTQKFYEYLQELEQSYSRLAELLHQKLNALLQHDLTALDAIMKEEQVYVLLSKGFDANLQTHRDKLGLRGDTLLEVIGELPEENRDDFHRLYKQLKATLDGVRGINQKCQSLIEQRLYSLDRSIKELDHSDNSTYQKTGNTQNGPSPHAGFLSKKI